MADRLRIVEFSDRRQRPVTILDVNDLVNTFTTREGGFNFTPPAKAPVMAGDERRFGGDTQRGESHGNGQASWTMGTKGASGNDCLTRLDAALAELNKAAVVGRYLEWRAEGASYSSYFPIRGTAAWNPLYKVRQFAGSSMIDTTVALPVAPLVEWDAMDILDDFSVDTITAGDWTLDAGAATLTIANGVLTTTSVAAKRAIHTVRGYTYKDVQAFVKVNGLAANGVETGHVLKRLDANNYLAAYVSGSAGAQRLDIAKVDAGAPTNLNNFTSGVPVGGTFWVRAYIIGNVVTVELYSADPALGGALTTNVSYTLAGANATKFGDGVAGATGLYLNNVPAGTWTIDDYRVEPFIRTARNLPEQIDWTDLIPGTAPALLDFHLGTTSGQQPVFAAFGWGRRPAAHSYIWNGDFEDSAMGTAGWRGSGAPLAGTTTLSRITTGSRFGAASMQAVTPATTNSGIAFDIYRPFKKGVTYTFEFYAYAAVSVTGMQAYLADLTAADIGIVDTKALNATWQKWTATWTPSADRPIGMLLFRTIAATATTLRIDGVIVYETALGPPTGKQAEGRGAVPPFGVIEAEACDTSTLTGGWAVAATAGTRGGYRAGAIGSGASGSLELLVDPSLIAPDDFRGEVDVEVWARVYNDPLNANQRLIVSVLPDEGIAYGAERFTNEWGAVGRALPASTSGAWRLSRAGTVTLPVDPANPARRRLRVALTVGAGSTGSPVVDQLILLPAKARCASPSGKANDTTYPKFAPSSGETRRVIRADGKGLIGKPAGTLAPYPGPDGARCWPEPGALSMVALLSDTVPDNPTVDSSADSVTLTAALIHAGVVPRSYHARGA